MPTQERNRGQVSSRERQSKARGKCRCHLQQLSLMEATCASRSNNSSSGFQKLLLERAPVPQPASTAILDTRHSAGPVTTGILAPLTPRGAITRTLGTTSNLEEQTPELWPHLDLTESQSLRLTCTWKSHHQTALPCLHLKEHSINRATCPN